MITLTTMRGLVRYFFGAVGFDVHQQLDGSAMVRDLHGDCWRVTVTKIEILESTAHETQ